MPAARHFAVALALVFWSQFAAAADPKWESLLPEIQPGRDRVAGEWTKSDDALSVKAAQGARLMLPVAPQGEYDVRATFTRKTGQHSVGLVLVVGGRQTVFEVDAWGSHLAGFQNVGGKTIRENPTRRDNVALENNRKYTITVEVRKDQIRGLLDGKEISKLATDGQNVSMHDLWALPDTKRLGLVAWESDTVFHAVEMWMLNGDPLPIVRADAPSGSKPVAGTPTRPAPTTPPARPANPLPTTTPAPTTTASTPAPNSNAGRGKRVLIVVANRHFFYREYGDPRQELERAGIRVTVAAGTKGRCVPHEGSGQGADGGIIQADVALKDVKAKDYDAILFSGGWGASAYQYAFNGRYNDPVYNGEKAVKAEVNRVIGEFVAQDKYVCALCNGVSVLAWARVDGKSLLAGKRVCAPARQAPAGIYDGRPAQPSCRWHPEANGAILSPPGSIGRPGTNVDDVLVDGKVITGEDDPSAREMGRKIVDVLTR